MITDKIQIILADITKINTDAIVCSSNKSLFKGSGLSKFIYEAARAKSVEGEALKFAPVIFYLQRNAQADILKTVSTISSLTHAHQRCIMCCYIYVVLGLQLLKNPGQDKTELFKKTMTLLAAEVKEKFAPDETELLARLYDIENFINLSRDEIKSSGYVIDTLEASLWCFLTTDNFKDCILKAVNLGDDADTVAAIAGAFAGLYYGLDAIPEEWVGSLLGKENIYKLCGM